MSVFSNGFLVLICYVQIFPSSVFLYFHLQILNDYFVFHVERSIACLIYWYLTTFASAHFSLFWIEIFSSFIANCSYSSFSLNRFLDAIKQYLCLSLLKNTASSLMIIFQLSCSIFMSLVSRFRAGLKAEIGVFYPMIVLRVLENVALPNFQQKMIVLRFLEKLCVDSQILIDIFLNYDCDVNASNIFER